LSLTSWYVYFVRCADDSLYAGITTDIERRVKEHNSSVKGAKYTRARRPVTLAYSAQFSSRSEASKGEYQLRKLTRQQKEQLVLAYQSDS
jgi:putative endonuclease